jgi:hypothetical protein
MSMVYKPRNFTIREWGYAKKWLTYFLENKTNQNKNPLEQYCIQTKTACIPLSSDTVTYYIIVKTILR